MIDPEEFHRLVEAVRNEQRAGQAAMLRTVRGWAIFIGVCAAICGGHLVSEWDRALTAVPTVGRTSGP